MSDRKVLDVIQQEDPECAGRPSAQYNPTRRLVIRKMAVGTAAVAGCSLLPEKWVTPLVEFGTLPAHATTSGALEAIIEELNLGIEESQAGDQPAAETQKADAKAAAASEVDDNRGYANQLTIENKGAKVSIDKIWRDKFVFPKLGPEYGPTLLIVWSDGRELYVPDSKKMTMYGSGDERKYQPGGPYSGNNPDIPTMEVYAAMGTHPDNVTLYY
jgi:hypothetical protein